MTYGYDFSFKSSMGHKRVEGRGFPSAEERDQAFSKALWAFGYEVPKWWQFWRFFEDKPSVSPKPPSVMDMA